MVYVVAFRPRVLHCKPWQSFKQHAPASCTGAVARSHEKPSLRFVVRQMKPEFGIVPALRKAAFSVRHPELELTRSLAPSILIYRPVLGRSRRQLLMAVSSALHICSSDTVLGVL